MRGAGRRCPIEDGYDLDVKINDVADCTKEFITNLKSEVGERDYIIIARIIIQEHLEAMNLTSIRKKNGLKKY